MTEARADVRNVEHRPIVQLQPRAGERRTANGGPIERQLPYLLVNAAHLPIDPPLPDVPLPVKKPHSKAAGYSVDVLEERFPTAEVVEEVDILFGEAGNRDKSRLRPDMFVALSVPRSDTLADFDVDELGAPDFILEVLSRTTWRIDLRRKLNTYQKLGVRECLFFDPTGENLARNGRELWGYALTPTSRQALEERRLSNGERCIYSEVLGLVAYVLERVPPNRPGETWALKMRWRDPATDEDLLYRSEVQAEAEAQRRRAEAALAKVAELERMIRAPRR